MDSHRSRQRSKSRSRSRERDRERHRQRDSDSDGRLRDRGSEGRYDERDRHRDRSRQNIDESSSRRYDRGRGEDRDRDRDKDRSRRDDGRDRRDGRRGDTRKSKHDNASKVAFSSDLDDGYFDRPKEEDETFDEDALAEINGFLEEEEEEETEEQQLARLEKERRLRREAILSRHQLNGGDSKDSTPCHTTVCTTTTAETTASTTVLGVTEQSRVVPMFSEPTTNNPTDTIVAMSGTSGFTESAADSLNNTSMEEDDMAREEVALAREEQDGKNHVKTFDIFSSSPTAMALTAAGGGGQKQRLNKGAVLMEGDDPLLESNWDDGEGYYSTRVGEVVCDRYRVMGEVGKGVFSTAIKCIDVKKHDNLVVLKIIRNNDIMRKASEKEIFLLQLIAQTDPQNKKHCVRLLGNTEYRNHVVLAFECLGMNLRETVKKFGKHVGINVTAVRLYARQLFVALRHLTELKIVHADIKPDNILVSEDLKQVKICDFGSAFRETDSDNDPTPYLQSRFYRAPEIVLGLNYDRMIDLWSVGACLYELFTGHVMFAGRTNNEMIRLHMEYKGKIPNKVVKAHQRSFDILELDPHFDSDFKFKMHDIDPVTNKPIMRLVDITAPKKNIATILLQSKAGADDRQMVIRVADVLEKCLVLDPSKRVSVPEILKHPLFTAK